MRIKLKKVTVASLNASLVDSCLPVIHSTISQNQDWYLLKFSEDLHEWFVLLVAFARGR
jgi:hypothetical protein